MGTAQWGKPAAVSEKRRPPRQRVMTGITSSDGRIFVQADEGLYEKLP